MAVFDDWGEVTAIGGVFTILTGVASWLFMRGGGEAVLKQQVKAAEDQLKAANDRASRSEQNYDQLLERLHAHMLSDAAAFAKLESMTAEASRSGMASEQRLTTAIDKLVTRLDAMSDRFDSLITRLAPAQ